MESRTPPAPAVVPVRETRSLEEPAVVPIPETKAPEEAPRRAEPPAQRIVKQRDDPRAEANLIDAARAALANDAERALRLAGEHQRRFGDGLLVPERELIAVESLLELGRREEAEKRAQEFFEREAGSPLERRMRLLLDRHR